MNKITIIEDNISINLLLKLNVQEEEYNIELNDLTCYNTISLEKMKKDAFNIEHALERYNEIKTNIVKEKYKDFKEFILQKDNLSKRKKLYLKSDILYYEIGYEVEKDISIGMSVVEEQVIERESKFDVSLDTALSRYNELKIKLSTLQV